MAPPPVVEFQCVWCYEDLKEPGYRPNASEHNPEEGYICRGCAIEEIIPKFELAFKDGSEYPPKWGKTLMTITDFEELFDDDFPARYKHKVATEYKVKADMRVYCAHKATNADGAAEVCSGFLGAKEQVGRTCPKCSRLCCCNCAEPVEGSYEQHQCGKVDDVDPLGVRGIDYQVCPKCGEAAHRKDGCNSIVCPACRQSYCYLCGTKAHHDARHWRRSNGCTKWNLPTDPNADHPSNWDKELDLATAPPRRDDEDDEQYEFRWSRISDFTDWAERFDNYTKQPVAGDDARQEARGRDLCLALRVFFLAKDMQTLAASSLEVVKQDLLELELSFETARPLLDARDFWAHLDAPRFNGWGWVHPYLNRYARAWREPCIRQIAAMNYLIHMTRPRVRTTNTITNGFLEQMLKDSESFKTIPADHEIRNSTIPGTSRQIRDVAWMFASLADFRAFLEQQALLDSRAKFADMRWKWLVMRNMTKHIGDYTLCEQPFSTHVDVAYGFMIMVLEASSRRLKVAFSPWQRLPDFEFVVGDTELQRVRDVGFKVDESLMGAVMAMIQANAATIRFQPRMKLYMQHLMEDLRWMSTVVDLLHTAEGCLHPRIRRAFIQTHTEILMLGGIMRSSKFTFLNPMLAVLTIYMDWAPPMLRHFECEPPAGSVSGIGDPRNIRAFDRFTNNAHAKTIADLNVLGLPSSGDVNRKAWPNDKDSDKPFMIVHSLSRVFDFRDAMLNAVSTQHDLGRAKVFVDDLYEIFSACTKLFAEDVFQKYDRNTWPSRQAVWSLLKALSEWHDDVGTRIALSLLPTSQKGVRPFQRYMDLLPWNTGPETDITAAYRRMHEKVRAGPMQAQEREAERMQMMIG